MKKMFFVVLIVAATLSFTSCASMAPFGVGVDGGNIVLPKVDGLVTNVTMDNGNVVVYVNGVKYFFEEIHPYAQWLKPGETVSVGIARIYREKARNEYQQAYGGLSQGRVLPVLVPVLKPASSGKSNYAPSRSSQQPTVSSSGGSNYSYEFNVSSGNIKRVR